MWAERGYNDIVIVWDEAKRISNIVKHGYDFAEAYMVYNSANKLELETIRGGERRKWRLRWLRSRTRFWRSFMWSVAKTFE